MNLNFNIMKISFGTAVKVFLFCSRRPCQVIFVVDEVNGVRKEKERLIAAVCQHASRPFLPFVNNHYGQASSTVREKTRPSDNRDLTNVMDAAVVQVSKPV